MTHNTLNRQGQSWDVEEERKLYNAFTTEQSIDDIASEHQRTTGGIRSRLRQLGLLDADNNVVVPRPDFLPSPISPKRQIKLEAQKSRRIARLAEKAKHAPEMNARFKHALHLMEDTHKNLFITGKAGTGKSTLLSYFCNSTDKQPVVLAPTGVAALNVKGQTIHRFFNFYVDVTVDQIRRKTKIRNPKLFKKLKTIIIDEVSMVRADLLDCIDVFLRMHGPDTDQAFGGVQMIFVGDLYQLPPVVSTQEREIFATLYETPYFFSANVMREAGLELVELDKVYRQKDQAFVDLLNKIRNNSVSSKDIDEINSRLGQSLAAHGKSDFHITLTTTNAVADDINAKQLNALKGRVYTSNADIDGKFDKEYFPTQPDLSFKIGAQVMMLNNDSEQRWVNGSIGVVESVDEDEVGDEFITIRLQDDNDTVDVYPFTWEVYRFGVEGGEITSAPVGTFRQYPFRLAWGITIHKSQGKTFERVVIDIGRGAFAAGQIYVALSRCTSFAGVSLISPIRAQDIRTDQRILAFLEGYQPRIKQFDESDTFLVVALATIQSAIEAGEVLNMTYQKADGAEMVSKVKPLRLGSFTYQGETYEGMKAFCLQDNVERTYRVDRILSVSKVA